MLTMAFESTGLTRLVFSVLVCISPVFSADLPDIQTESSNWAPQCPLVHGKIPRLIPNPTNCRSVFVCAHGKARQFYCPKGQVFSGPLQMCLKQKGCKKDTDEMTAYLSCPEKNGRDIVQIPHPTDCTMFYKCDHGTAYPQQCPSNLHYNPKLRVCDWPYKAGCTARVLSEEP